MKFKVYGTVRVHMTVEVEAEDAEGAIEAAEEFGGLTGYCGNGGNDKLVGTAERNVSLDVGDEYAEFTEAEPA